MKKFVKEQLTFNTVQVASMGLLIALEIILNRFCSINVWNLKIGVAFIPVMLAGMLMGPLKAGMVGALADFVGAILFPIGAYFPGFTLTAFIRGILYGALLYKKQTALNIAIVTLVDQLILSLFLTPLWISVLYGAPYLATVYSRLFVQVLPLLPVELIVAAILPKLLVERLKPYINMDFKKKKTVLN